MAAASRYATATTAAAASVPWCCSRCGREVGEQFVKYHQMQCERVSKTGDSLIDMIVTFIRHNGDYNSDGADLRMLFPSLQADGWTVEQCREELDDLVERGYIFMVGDDDHFRFNYYLLLSDTPPGSEGEEDSVSSNDN